MIIGLVPGLLGEAILTLGLVYGLRSFSSVATWLASTLVVVALLTLVVVAEEVREGMISVRAKANWERLFFQTCILVSLLILSVGFCLAFLPPTQKDALIQHLAVPKLYLEQGGIVPFPFITPSYYPMAVDMLFLIPLSLGWDSGAQMISLLFGVLTAGLLYSFLKREFDPMHGIVGSTLFLVTPAVFPLLFSAYVDLALTFYTASGSIGIILFLRAKSVRWLVLAGLSVGLGGATKYLGLLVFVILALLLVFSLSRQKMRASTVIGNAVLFGFLALLPFLPWAFRNLVWTGNPIYPLSGISVGESGFSPLLMRGAFYGESWVDLLLLPLRVFFSGKEGDPRRFDGVLGPGLILFPLVAVWGSKKKGMPLLTAFSLLFMAFNLELLPVRARYLLPMVPAASILGSVGLANLLSSLKVRSLAILAFVGCLLFFAFHAGLSFNKLRPIPYLLGQEDREAFLSSRLKEYSAVSFANQYLPHDARIYLLLSGDRGYYLNREYVYDLGQSARRLSEVIQDAKGMEDIVGWFLSERVSHLLCQDQLLDRFLRDNLSGPQLTRWTEAQKKLKPLFSQNGFTIYALPHAHNSNDSGI
jgi:hypothetical protein